MNEKSRPLFSPQTQQKLYWFAALLPVLLASAIWGHNILYRKPVDWFTLGLDLRGGLSVVYEADWLSVSDDLRQLPRKQILDLCRDILLDRLDGSQIYGAEIRVAPAESRIYVDIPNVSNPNSVFGLLGRTGKLEFRLVRDETTDVGPTDSAATNFTYRGRGYAANQTLGPPLFTGDQLDPSEVELLRPDPTSVDREQREFRIAFNFRKNIRNQFDEFALRNRGQKVAIVLDRDIQVIAKIGENVGGGGTWILTGGYTPSEARNHWLLLKHGQLPVDLRQTEVLVVGASLGTSLREKGYQAIAWGAVVLLAILVLFYGSRPWLLLSAIISLLVLAVTFTAALSFTTNPSHFAQFMLPMKVTLDIVSIAGCVLTLGMGIDSAVIILESLREPLIRAEKSHLQLDASHQSAMVRNSYTQDFERPVLWHTNVTNILGVVFLLFALPLRSYAAVMILGTAITIINIFLTRKLLLATRSAAQTVLPFFPSFEFRSFDFRKWKSIGLAFSLLSVSAGVFFLLTSKSPSGWLSWGSEFKAGSQILVKLPSACNIEEVLLAARHAIPGDWKAQHIAGEGGDKSPSAPILYRLSAPTSTLATLGRSSVTNSITEQRTIDKVALDKETRSAAEQSAAPTAVPKDQLDPARAFFSNLDVIAATVGGSAELLQVSSIGPAVASERLFKSVIFLVLSFVAVALYIFFFIKGDSYAAAGTIIAVAHDILAVVAVLAVLRIPVGYGVIAGILTVIGYSVNDSIILLVRTKQVRDDVKSGHASPEQVVGGAISECFGRTLVTSLTTLAPMIVVAVLGGDALRGFAVTVSAGVIFGTLSSLFIVGNFALLRYAKPKPAPPAIPVSEEDLKKILTRKRENL